MMEPVKKLQQVTLQAGKDLVPSNKFPSNKVRPRGYKTFCLLNSAKQKVYPAHKC